jgi:hypothetical protein
MRDYIPYQLLALVKRISCLHESYWEMNQDNPDTDPTNNITSLKFRYMANALRD